MTAIGRMLMTVLPIAAIAGCAINPVTGEPELALVSENQEITMGRDAAQQVSATIGLVDDAVLQQYVATIGHRLAATSERPGLPWEFHVVDDPTPNAFALPGGFIFVTRGLMNLMNSEAELAAILGHEIGHVTAKHSVSQMSRAQLAQIGLQVGSAVSPEIAEIGDLAGTGLGLLFLKYGRDDERQADELGFGYMLGDRYDVRGMVDVFEVLSASGELSGQTSVPTWLASHPSEPERIAATQSRIDELDPQSADLKSNSAAYLEHIDGLTYGEDPRAGYFADGKFIHPGLAFQFDVPETWQKQNLQSAVQAVSPNEDAALTFTLEPGSADDAAAEFLSRDGIEVVQSDPTQIDGRSAIVSRFRGQAGNGIVDGIVAHIEATEGTYRLLTYSATTSFDSYQNLFADIIESVSSVSHADLVGVEARRVSVVMLESEMTLAEFSRRFPSAITLEELAVINQIADPNVMLPEGITLKRVV